MRYFFVCLGLSTAFFLGLKATLDAVGVALLPLTLVVFQSINFHHYTVDAVVWRRRKTPATRPTAWR